jgi:hypothetical protein
MDKFAECLKKGRGVAQDSRRARQYYEMAAQNEVEPAAGNKTGGLGPTRVMMITVTFMLLALALWNWKF